MVMQEAVLRNESLKGTCYKAANWRCIGQTKGRSRQDRYAQLSVPKKDILIYPLTKKFRQALCQRET